LEVGGRYVPPYRSAELYRQIFVLNGSNYTDSRSDVPFWGLVDIIRPI